MKPWPLKSERPLGAALKMTALCCILENCILKRLHGEKSGSQRQGKFQKCGFSLRKRGEMKWDGYVVVIDTLNICLTPVHLVSDYAVRRHVFYPHVYQAVGPWFDTLKPLPARQLMHTCM
jgi:hypothetical protein